MTAKKKEEMTVAQMMLALISLCTDDVSLKFSEHTKKWYVSCLSLGHGNEYGVSYRAPHCDNPEDSVREYFEWLTNPTEEYAISKRDSLRQYTYWRWNGGAFVLASEP